MAAWREVVQSYDGRIRLGLKIRLSLFKKCKGVKLRIDDPHNVNTAANRKELMEYSELITKVVPQLDGDQNHKEIDLTIMKDKECHRKDDPLVTKF